MEESGSPRTRRPGKVAKLPTSIRKVCGSRLRWWLRRSSGDLAVARLTEIEKVAHGFWKCGARGLDGVWLTDFGECWPVPGRCWAVVKATVCAAEIGRGRDADRCLRAAFRPGQLGRVKAEFLADAAYNARVKGLARSAERNFRLPPFVMDYHHDWALPRFSCPWSKRHPRSASHFRNVALSMIGFLDLVSSAAPYPEKNCAQSHAGESWAPDHAFNEASAAAAKRVLKGLRGVSQRALRARPSGGAGLPRLQ